MRTITSLVNNLLQLAGLELRRVQKGAYSKGCYETLYPWASYAPWRKSEEFWQIYSAIEGYTLADLYRCWELWDLASQCEILPGHFLEVGTWRGGTAAILCSCAARLGGGRRVYIADTFSGVPKATERDSSYTGGEHSDTSEETVERLLRDSLGLHNYRILKGIFPDATGQAIEQEVICLCHIDVDVYESSKGVLDWLLPRLCRGGLAVIDDYGFSSTPGITESVNELRGHADLISLYNLNGHAVLIKIK